MRICSLLPSITEILFEIGLGEHVVGVTHECDWPPPARSRPHLTHSRIRGEGCNSAEIDRQVREQTGSLYELDAERLAELRPDIIFTQSLCPVCAMDEIVVRRVAATLSGIPTVYSFCPTCLREVIETIDVIGSVTGAVTSSQALSARFRAALESAKSPVAGSEAIDVVCLEWTDPLFTCGHWTPELIAAAGGRELLGRAGEPSRVAKWEELRAANPAVLVLAPCGLTLDRAFAELAGLETRPGWHELRAVRNGRVFVCDGSAYFNRPGPRLIDTLHILGKILHPDRFGGTAPSGGFQQVEPGRRISQ